jgi:uncharacterized protein (TIGR00730 family)
MSQVPEVSSRDNETDQVIEIVPTAGRTALSICVFCSANNGLSEKYIEPARQFGRLVAERGHTLLWGGSDSGLMREVSSAAQEAGGRIVGISVEFLRHKTKLSADEMIIAADLGERKALLLKRSDAIVTMVGGIGTIDEVTEIVEHRNHGHHNKPVVIMDTDHYYEGFNTQLLRMEADGFLTQPLSELVLFAETPEETMAAIEGTLL